MHVTRIAVRPPATPSPAPRPSTTSVQATAFAVVKTHLVRTLEGHARRSPSRRVGRTGGARPIWYVAAARSGNIVAQSGTGSGAGAAGSGTGATSGDEPCGFVEFSNPHGSQYDRATGGFHVDIRMSVHFADGSSQSLILDYPWYYPNEAANPWSAQNVKNPNFPTRFQPPPESKAAGEPPLVQYVIAHSTADGLTLLKDCPNPAPTPAV
jgi:hypothetical protein